MALQHALLFDLDGTLIDSTYHHVMAWQVVFARQGLRVPLWKIHRLIGISGSRLLDRLLTEAGQTPTDARTEELEAAHADVFRTLGAETAPLPGAVDLLELLSSKKVPWAIATTGKRAGIARNLRDLGADTASATVITRDDVSGGKPEPDVFLKAAEVLDVPIERCIVVGDSIWDMLGAARSRALAVGLRCGGTDVDALREAGAIRVYEDPADLIFNLADVVAA